MIKFRIYKYKDQLKDLILLEIPKKGDLPYVQGEDVRYKNGGFIVIGNIRGVNIIRIYPSPVNKYGNNFQLAANENIGRHSREIVTRDIFTQWSRYKPYIPHYKKPGNLKLIKSESLLIKNIEIMSLERTHFEQVIYRSTSSADRVRLRKIIDHNCILIKGASTSENIILSDKGECLAISKNMFFDFLMYSKQYHKPLKKYNNLKLLLGY